MKPSDFLYDDPMNSVLQKSEYETIASNVMIILKRTGNKFRLLDWQEYKSERTKDGASEYCVMGEKRYFDKVVEYCASAESAKKFSKNWYKN